MAYTDKNRKSDFDYFVENYQKIYDKYGHKYVAIKNGTILGAYNEIPEAISDLQNKYKVGTYIIQECSGDNSTYKTTIMRMVIGG